MREQRFSVVVPTTGGPGLQRLVGALADSLALADRAALDLHEVVVVDDRPGSPGPLDLPEPGPLRTHLRTIRTGGRGAAAARNAGWRSTSAPWVVFLDDDTELTGSWADDLVVDLEGASPATAVLTARAGSTVTDVAYRRDVLRSGDGFDERRGRSSPRLGSDDRSMAAGSRLSHARVGPEPAGTARPGLTVPLLAAAGVVGVIGLVVRRPVVLAIAGGLGAAALVTARRADETEPWPPRLKAVLFDRDGTLIRDVPYNGDPSRVEPAPGAREAIAAARRAGLKVGVVTNQSGVGRGLITGEQVDAVNARVEQLLGPMDTWQICPHAPDDDCTCRKPAPAMILAAARELGVEPYECAYIGDQADDAAAAHAAGARPVLIAPAGAAADDGTTETATDPGAAVAMLTRVAAAARD
jgi:histidinol-phosphate phosphatase family protein